MAIGIAAAAALGRNPRPTQGEPVWDISSLGGTYIGIGGTLGGFSATSAVFVAGLDGARDSPAFASVIGMLLIAFLILIFSALLYASGPNAPVETNDTVIRSSFSMRPAGAHSAGRIRGRHRRSIWPSPPPSPC
jgi:hypothetical protein